MIYLRLAAYGLAALLLFGAGWKVASWRDSGILQARIASDATDRANAETAIRTALQAQLVAAQTTARTNAQIVENLQHENANVVAARDANLALAHRLLTRQTCPASSTHSVPETPDQPGASGTSNPGASDSLAGDLVAAADGYERCVNQLNALIAELKPQL